MNNRGRRKERVATFGLAEEFHDIIHFVLPDFDWCHSL